MAETKKTAKKSEMEEIFVPFKDNEDSMFVGLNFRNYILKRGTYVTVPKEVAKLVRASVEEENEARRIAIEKEQEYLRKSANPTM